MTEKIYYDNDADIRILSGKTVGVIGYGIQGRAQSLNIRDSRINVIVANRQDKYAQIASEDGFKVHAIDEMVRGSDIIMFLIPDQAQADVYERSIKGNIRPGSMLVFAHGYSLRYQTITIASDIDVAMLAPRMPGKQIRDSYLKGEGVPVFIDVVQDASGKTKEALLALAKAAGFTRAGALEVSYKVEAELDLFTEQFLVAAIVKAIDTSYKVLVNEKQYPPIATLMELYASSELAEVLKMASWMGIGNVFQKNASPTCQYGIAAHFDSAMGDDPAKKAKEIIRRIQDGSFSKELDKDGTAGYPSVRKLWEDVNGKNLVEAQEWINASFRRSLS